MKLSPVIKVLLGFVTLLISAPSCVILALISGLALFGGQTIIKDYINQNFDSIWNLGISAITDYFGSSFILVCLFGLAWLGLLIFYLTHVIGNSLAKSWIRVTLAVGFILLPFVAMPIYYLVYIAPKRPSIWALRRDGHET